MTVGSLDEGDPARLSQVEAASQSPNVEPTPSSQPLARAARGTPKQPARQGVLARITWLHCGHSSKFRLIQAGVSPGQLEQDASTAGHLNNERLSLPCLPESRAAQLRPLLPVCGQSVARGEASSRQLPRSIEVKPSLAS